MQKYTTDGKERRNTLERTQYISERAQAHLDFPAKSPLIIIILKLESKEVSSIVYDMVIILEMKINECVAVVLYH